MPKRSNNLYDQITTKENLELALHKASKGKRQTFGYLEFKEYQNFNLKNLQEQLLDSSYQIGEYRHFYVFEPKPRLISALEFKDRIVQHALCNVITPIFEKSFLPYTFACRNGFGTHKGVVHIQSLLRKHDFKFYLKTDFSKFFPSIDRAILFNLIERKIKCRRTLDLILKIIPFDQVGLPIGNLTSQLFANLYGSVCDRFLHDSLKQRFWARYMDDIVVLGNDREVLLEVFKRLENQSLTALNLKMSKWTLDLTEKGINFLGYRIWQKHKLIRKSSVLKAKRKLKKFRKNNDLEALKRFKASFKGHTNLADCTNLLKKLEIY